MVNKEFLIKGTKEKTTLQVPKYCDKWEDGIQTNLDLALKYANQEASLKGSFAQVNLINQFSSRLKAIAIAQCKINQNSLIIDLNDADHKIYNDMVQGYVEYQKIADLSGDLTSEQRSTIVNSLLKIYKTIYDSKYVSELSNVITDLICEFNILDGNNLELEILKNSSKIGTLKLASASNSYVIQKDQLVPEPGQEITFNFKLLSNDGTTKKEKTITLADLMTQAKNNKVTIRF